MFHFFVEPEQINDKSVIITGSDVNHIKNVIRLKPGDEISISNGMDGRDYRCAIESITDTEVLCELRFIKEYGVELSSKVYLFQGLPKGDKMELIIQKAVELGVYEIIPVRTKRVIVKLDDKKESKKIARWQQIAEGGAKQSGRGLIPEVKPVMGFAEALKYAGSLDAALIPYEKAEGIQKTRSIIHDLKGKKSVAIFIGPEGGFDEKEVEDAMNQGVFPVTLGRRILRTETAGLTMLSILMFEFEEE